MTPVNTSPTIISEHVCTGCALLCNDVRLTLDATRGKIVHTNHACIRGHRHLIRSSSENRASSPMLSEGTGKTMISWDDALKAARRLISQAKAPLIYGLGSVSNEAIQQAFSLAKASNIRVFGTPDHGYDDLSRLIQTEWAHRIVDFDTVRDKADVIIFWGSNPAETHPRYMSRYTVFPRGAMTPNGRESRLLACVDVRPSPSGRVSNHSILVYPGSDPAWMEGLSESIAGETSSRSFPKGQSGEHQSLTTVEKAIRDSQLTVLSLGGGLLTGQKSSEALIAMKRLFEALETRGVNWGVHLMVSQPNATGYLQHRARELLAGPPPLGGLKTDTPDVILVVGADPLSKLPRAFHSVFKGAKLLVLEPESSLTASKALLHFPTRFAGTEAGGTMTRLDNQVAHLTPFLPESGRLSDSEVLMRLG